MEESTLRIDSVCAVNHIQEAGAQLLHQRLVRDGLRHAVHRRPARQVSLRLLQNLKYFLSENQLRFLIPFFFRYRIRGHQTVTMIG